jgi:helix-turn-helix protein
MHKQNKNWVQFHTKESDLELQYKTILFFTLSRIYDNIAEHRWKQSNLSASTRELLTAVLEDTDNRHPVYINYCT